jgi:hypothetical protein
VLQRFGSALNLNLHFHILALDGVYVRTKKGDLSFRTATPRTEDVEALVVEIAEACEAFLAGEGFGADDTVEDDDDVQAVLQAASIQGRLAVGPRRTVRKVQTFGGKQVAMPPRCAGYDGYTLHAGVGIKASDRNGLERLCRYLLRPPLAKGRLARTEDGSVLVGMKRTWSDGTSALVLSPQELVERLAAIVPPPRKNQILYHGVLAAHSAWRALVVPKPIARPEPRQPKLSAPRTEDRPRKDTQLGWADLLLRVFGEDGFRCPTAPCR